MRPLYPQWGSDGGDRENAGIDRHPGRDPQHTDCSWLADEVSLARIYAGFHYRNSTEVGRAMGRQIGDYVVANAMQLLH